MGKSFHRRNLPHLHYDFGIYFITYRLANTIPTDMLRKIHNPERNWDFEKFKRAFIKYDSLLNNSAAGLYFLSQKNIAEICRYTLHYPDGNEYTLICYCIMPNHIHLVFKLLDYNKGISKIMQSIKRISARKSNLILGKEGKFWQDESYDRLVRNDVELYFIIRYVLLNPVNAHLVSNWEEWEYTYCNRDYLIL